MNRFLPHTRRRVLMLGAGCVACTALLAGVASAASNGPSTTPSPNSTSSAGGSANAPVAKGKLAQAVKEILQQVRSTGACARCGLVDRHSPCCRHCRRRRGSSKERRPQM